MCRFLCMMAAKVTLPRSAYELAHQSSIATAMARSLLVSMFDTHTLLTSNLKGGASKRPSTDDSVRFNKLDSRKLEAIYCRLKVIYYSNLDTGMILLR
jgi:hypothetical protein